MKQTAREFLQLAFAIVGYQKWNYRDHSLIRNEMGYCPIVALHREIFPTSKLCNGSYEVAAVDLGLDIKVADAIVSAADDLNDGQTRRLMKKLLIKQ